MDTVSDKAHQVYDWPGMSKTPHVRRIVVYLLVAAVLLAVVAPRAVGLLYAVIGILCFFIPISISIPLHQVDERGHTQQVLALPSFSPRPPPAL